MFKRVRLLVLVIAAVMAYSSVVGGQGQNFPVNGKSVVPFAFTNDPLDKTDLYLHNAGPAALVLRILFYRMNGDPVGFTEPEALAPAATRVVDLASVARVNGLDWQSGPVHVTWGARRATSLVTSCLRIHLEPDDIGNLQVISLREVKTVDFGP